MRLKLATSILIMATKSNLTSFEAYKVFDQSEAWSLDESLEMTHDETQRYGET